MGIYFYINLGVVLFIGVTTILIMRYKTKQLKKSKEISKSQMDEFVEIKSFNENQYIEDTFNTIFHSIQIDNWELEVNYEEITFSKNPEGSTSVWDKIDLKVQYNIKDGKFKISAIYLSAGTFFTHKGDIKEDDYKFFYKKYAEYKNKLNEDTKELCDQSMVKIHNVIGKASLRDSKLDDILGS